jgi:hypothetical protein
MRPVAMPPNSVGHPRVLLTADAVARQPPVCRLRARTRRPLLAHRKHNQPTLLHRLRALPWDPDRGREPDDGATGHGQVETRSISVVGLYPCPDAGGELFPHAAQAIKLVRRRPAVNGRK